MTYSTILTSLNQGLFLITINRPEKLNALNRDVIRELGSAMEEVYSNPEIRLAVITGAGEKSFVAGADISEFSELDVTGGTQLARTGQELVFSKIENCPKPVIAAVNGFALGGGCELAMACHIRICSDNAKFGQPEVNLGLIPGYGGTQRLTHLIGKGKAMELLMTGNMIGAAEALQLGLANHVTGPDALMGKTNEIATLIMSKAPAAISHVIQLVNLASEGNSSGLETEIRLFGELFGTADAREGAAAFMEKRKPAFTGK